MAPNKNKVHVSTRILTCCTWWRVLANCATWSWKRLPKLMKPIVSIYWKASDWSSVTRRWASQKHTKTAKLDRDFGDLPSPDFEPGLLFVELHLLHQPWTACNKQCSSSIHNFILLYYHDFRLNMGKFNAMFAYKTNRPEYPPLIATTVVG